MIQSFKHKGLERFFRNGGKRGIPAQSAARIERMLDRLDAVARPEDMDLPGYKFGSSWKSVGKNGHVFSGKPYSTRVSSV